MKYNNEWAVRNKERGFVFFWENDAEKPFSQWYPSPFKVNDILFETAEHWMMYHKALTFNDTESAEAILKDPDPAAAKRAGKLVKGFDPQKWDEVKYDIVLLGTRHKFAIPSFQMSLIETGRKILVEASPYDKIWGIGMAVEDEDIEDPSQWRGENLLGYALMEVRDELNRIV